MDRRKTFIKRAKKRRALHEWMTPGFWNAHHIIPAFVALVGLGMALGIAHFSSLQPYKAQATSADNIQGWAWADTIGWVSLNDQNPSSCGTPPCGSYGINVALTATAQPSWDPSQPPGTMTTGHEITGFVWSDNVGFICFGRSCNIPACTGSLFPDPPYHPPTYTANKFFAYVDPIIDTSPKRVHGWAVICNQKDAGWISLNCEDTGTCSNPPVAGDRNYRLIYNPTDKRFYVNPYSGKPAATVGLPFGWNGNSDGSGIGYVNFFPDPLTMNGMHLVPTAEICGNGIDDDLNGLTDCADPACSSLPACASEICNGLDDNGNGLIDETFACIQNSTGTCTTSCGSTGTRQCSATCTWGACVPPAENCTNGIDDDCNGLVDAADPACVTNQPTCTDDPVCNTKTGQDKIDCCCNNNSTDGPHPLDCLDPLCQAQAPKVCSAWVKVSTGNIYAQKGIKGTAAPKAAGTNATYCLRANDVIEWTGQSSCSEQAAGQIESPAYPYYRNKLGFLDLAGIRSGRYGDVITVNSAADIPTNLAGKIYRFIGNGATFVLSSKTFDNGSAPANRGNGLLFIDGGNLEISGDIGYTSNPVQNSLHNLASFGVIVVKDQMHLHGDIFIDPSVQKVSGTYFSEGIIHTGTVGSATDVNLTIYGILVANQFKLERNNGNNLGTPAENVIFDGRAVANPPPGMQDASKSLPQSDITF